MERKQWPKGSPEYRVEQFYGWGAEHYGDFHGGYLNFGLWEQDTTQYETAAQQLVHRISIMIGLDSQSKVLDIACGMGAQDIYLHKTFGCTIHAIDVTWKHMEHVDRRVQKEKLDFAINYSHDTAVPLSFPKETFTHILSVEAAEHFHTREDFFKEGYRVLKPGGKIGLGDFIMLRKPKKLWEKLVFHGARKLWHIPQENIVDVDGYKNQLRSAGFTNILIETVGAKTIPGYYSEQKRKDVKKSLRKIRGWFATYIGHIIDIAAYKAFTAGLIEYVLVHAEKPTSA